jgi:RNA polymerase sigma factor (TIGR02999 family)
MSTDGAFVASGPRPDDPPVTSGPKAEGASGSSGPGAGHPADATGTLFTLVYDELKRVARRQISRVDAGATLSTTELVHEAYIKLSRDGDTRWDGPGHFWGTAARAMRQVLVDFARRRRASKRGGRLAPVTLGDAEAPLQLQVDEILALDRALDQLDHLAPRLRQVVEMRFFAGLSEAEIAGALGVSVRTVERDWLKARLVLLRELAPGTIEV